VRICENYIYKVIPGCQRDREDNYLLGCCFAFSRCRGGRFLLLWFLFFLCLLSL